MVDVGDAVGVLTRPSSCVMMWLILRKARTSDNLLYVLDAYKDPTDYATKACHTGNDSGEEGGVSLDTLCMVVMTRSHSHSTVTAQSQHSHGLRLRPHVALTARPLIPTVFPGSAQVPS